MPVVSATARHITFARFGGQVSVYDASTQHKIGVVDLRHGFAHYTGVKGQSHEGMTAVVRGGIDGLTAALAEGLRNGRDDRRTP